MEILDGLGGEVGDTGKTEMPSGRLAFATRRVDLMAASKSTIPPLQSVGEKLDQMPN